MTINKSEFLAKSFFKQPSLEFRPGLDLKVERDTHFLNSKGRLFHMVGAATVKERPPYVFRLNLGNQGDND